MDSDMGYLPPNEVGAGQLVQEIMTKQKFEKIRQYIHFNSRVQTGRARPASLAREPIVRPVWTALGLPRAHVGSPERRSAPSHALSVFADAQRRLSLSCSLGVDGRKDTREPMNEKWIKKTVFA